MGKLKIVNLVATVLIIVFGYFGYTKYIDYKKDNQYIVIEDLKKDLQSKEQILNDNKILIDSLNENFSIMKNTFSNISNRFQDSVKNYVSLYQSKYDSLEKVNEFLKLKTANSAVVINDKSGNPTYWYIYYSVHEKLNTTNGKLVWKDKISAGYDIIKLNRPDFSLIDVENFIFQKFNFSKSENNIVFLLSNFEQVSEKCYLEYKTKNK